MNEEMLNAEMTEMTVDENMKANLLSAAKWAKFLCVIACIGVGVLLLIAVLMLLISKIPYATGVGLLYFILAVIYIYPILKGFQFANSTKSACLYNEKEDLAHGFEGLRSLLQFTGILTIIILVLYVLIVIGVIIGRTLL